MEEVVALLPIKQHSERIPNKNFRDFCGKPLYQWILETLLGCKSISSIHVNTDSTHLINSIAGMERVNVARRPEHLCGDYTSMNSILQYDVGIVNADLYIQTHATNPLLRGDTIESAIKKFKKEEGDSLFSVTPLQARFWDVQLNPINHSLGDLKRTQDLDPLYEENSNIYIFTKQSILDTGRRIGKNPIAFEISREESWDIDELLDFQIAQFLMERRLEMEC